MCIYIIKIKKRVPLFLVCYLQKGALLTAHRSLTLKISPTFTGSLWLNLRKPEPALPHSLNKHRRALHPHYASVSQFGVVCWSRRLCYFCSFTF